jgi:hypothetical protein
MMHLLDSGILLRVTACVSAGLRLTHIGIFQPSFTQWFRLHGRS